MKKRTFLIGLFLSLTSLSQTLITKTLVVVSSSGISLSSISSVNAQDGFFFFIRGDQKYEAEDYKGAIKDYSKGLEIYPNNGNAYLQRGNAKEELKDYEGAIKDYEKAIQLNPKDSIPLMNMD